MLHRNKYKNSICLNTYEIYHNNIFSLILLQRNKWTDVCVVFYFKESRRYYLWCEIKITNNKKCYFADFFAFWYICNRVYFQGNKSCCTQCWLLLLFHAGSSFIFSGHASHVVCGSIRRRLGSSSSPSSTPTWPNKPESVRVVVCKKY